MNTPTPPAGYKLVKGEDIKDCVPEGALFSEFGQPWVKSQRIGKPLRFPFQLEGDYAIPETKPEHPNKAAKVAKLAEIPDDALVFAQWIHGHWISVNPLKKSRCFATDDWLAYTDASGVHPDHHTAPYDIKADDAKVHQDLHIEAIESHNPLSQQEGSDHYKGLAIQPVEFIQANKLSFLEGCVVKRVCRHRAKNKAEDIRKAIHELRLILKLEYGEES